MIGEGAILDDDVPCLDALVQVIARAACQKVTAFAADENVIGFIAIEYVDAATALQDVGTLPPYR